MILREGVNSPLMKFAEDIKLEGVVNTNEDSKTVQRDLGGKTWQETESRGREGGCWPASRATWRARERGRASQGCVEPGAATASLGSGQAGNLKNLSFPICKIGLVDKKDALQL